LDGRYGAAIGNAIDIVNKRAIPSQLELLLLRNSLRAGSQTLTGLLQQLSRLSTTGAELNAIRLYGHSDPEGEDFPLLVKHSQNATSDDIASKSPLARYLTDGLAKLGL